MSRIVGIGAAPAGARTCRQAVGCKRACISKKRRNAQGGKAGAMSAPLVSRLRWVADALTGKAVNTALERAECVQDEAGHCLMWRVWRAGPDGRWWPDDWRPPTSWMVKQNAAQGGAA